MVKKSAATQTRLSCNDTLFHLLGEIKASIYGNVEPVSCEMVCKIMIYKVFSRLNDFGQMAAMAVFGVTATMGVVSTSLAFAGILPWPDLLVTYDGQVVPWSGQALQIGVTLLLVMIAMFLPSARRVLRLETSHRQFEIGMDDITCAYRAAHMADRADMFDMHREFDAVRERYQHLKQQPELAEMDAELLTIAAQMSEQTRDLAEVYSDAKVARVREGLKQRMVDAERLQEKMQQAHSQLRELKRLMENVDAEESSVAAQMQRLREDVVEAGLFEPEFRPGRRVPHLATVPAE